MFIGNGILAQSWANWFNQVYQNMPAQDVINVKEKGAVGDDSTNDTAVLIAACAEAVSTGKKVYLPAGTYKTTSVIRTNAEIFGDSPLKSIIHNTGTGDGLDLGPASYHSLYENFQVQGNASSRDGITLYTQAGDNPAYMQFNHVYSTYNGRHGLYHRNAWGTKYRGCKFHYNAGLGIYLITLTGDPGTHNGVSFIQCESRWNGGTATGTTFSDAKGGVSINGATMVGFIGGIYESNNAWQFLLGQITDQSLQLVDIQDVYIEGRPPGSATVGGAFYFNRGSKINIENCEIGFGAGSGDTSYAFYIADTANVGIISERNNQYTGGGAGTSLYINAGASLKRKIEPVVTVQMGDTGGSGSPVTQTLLTASNDGAYKIIGTINVGRNNEQGGRYPFIATRYNSTRSVAVGAAIVGSATTAPTMAWSGDNLQITFGANHIGHIEFSYTQNSMPTTFTLNSAFLQRNDEISNLPF